MKLRTGLAGLCMTITFAIASPLHAALLNLEISGTNAESTQVNVDYVLDANPNTGTLTADGSLSFMTGTFFVFGRFDLTATIERTTGTILGGTLSIVDDWGGNGTQATSTTPIAFGFGVEDKFEFIFEQELAGGSLLAAEGANIGVILDGRPISTFNDPIEPSFTSAFSNGGFLGKSDSFATLVPEPAAGALVALIGLGFLARRKRHV